MHDTGDEYLHMIPAEPGTRAVFRRIDRETHKVTSEWTLPVVAWVQRRERNTDNKGPFAYVTFEPLIASFDGFAWPAREYDSDSPDSCQCVGFVFADGSSTEPEEREPGTYLPMWS